MSKTILGIDVSKKDLALALLVNEKIYKTKILNNQEGFLELLKWLDKHKIKEVTACLEATGHYGQQIADFLYFHNHKVSIINPSCIKAFANSKLMRHKTDEVDSVVIAEYASQNSLILYTPSSPEARQLKELYRCSQDLKNQRTQVICHIESSTLPYILNSWEKILKGIDCEIKELEKAIDSLIQANDSLKINYENLQTIPGVGKTTAAAVLAEIPDLDSFKNARQLAAYAGLVPQIRTSGSSVRGRSKLSKLGSSKLRKLLYFPAVVGKTHNPILKSFCDRLKSKNKPTMSIIGAAMRKLLHIIFGVIKNKTSFDSNFNHSN